MKYPIIKSDPNHLLKISEYSPTNLGPKIDPNTENQTARDKAVALKLSDATKDAAYLVWSVADWPIPRTNAPNNNSKNESIIKEYIRTKPPTPPIRNVFERALFLEYFWDNLSNICVPIIAPPTPTAFGNPTKYGLEETSLAARTVTVTAAIKPIEENATETSKLKIFLISKTIDKE